MGGDGHQRTHHPQGHGNGPQARFAQSHGVDRLAQPVFVVHKGGGHGRIGGRDNAQEKEKGQIVLNGQQGEREDVPIVGEGMNTNPKVGHGNAEARQVAGIAEQCKSVHQGHGQHDQNRNAHLAVNRPGGTAHGEQNQSGLGCDGILVMTKRQRHVHADQAQHQRAQELALRDTKTVQPTPTPCIERQPVEKFHRNDDPGDAEEVHRILSNPALTEPKADHRHAEQSETPDDGWQHRSNKGPNGGPHHDHGHGQTFPDGLFSVNGHLRG